MIQTSLIEAEVHAPTIVEVPEGTETIEITVRADLRNASETDYVLHSIGEDTHFWHVLDENHREVLRDRKQKKAKKKSDVHPVRTQTIPAGLSTHESVTLTLDTKKLKNGKIYTVRSENWGQVAEASFVAVRPKKAEAKSKPKRKTSTAKKTAAKSTAKKTAAKAPAKKKPARKRKS